MPDLPDPRTWNDLFEEEPWETDVARLLGGMPAVEPPAGFLARAVDHRPLFAGRTVVGLLGLSGVAALAAVAWIGFGSTVLPPLDDIAASHREAAGAIGVDGAAGASVGGGQVDELSVLGEIPETVIGAVFLEDVVAGATMMGLDQGAEDVDVPPSVGNAERVAMLHLSAKASQSPPDASTQDVSGTAGDPTAAMISIFRQHGEVDWGQLPEGDWMDLLGHRAWHGPKGDDSTVVMIRDADEVWMFVGLDPEALAAVAEPANPPDQGWKWASVRAAGDLSAQLGFPELD